MPRKAIKKPEAAGPANCMTLVTAWLVDTALMTRSRPTSSEIIPCFAGILKAKITPKQPERMTRSCQMMVPSRTDAAIQKDSMAESTRQTSQMVRREKRSATTPPTKESKSWGMAWASRVRPNTAADPVR